MTQIRDWPLRKRQLYRQALHQAMRSRMTPDLSFDAEENWQGDARPMDIKTYWANLTDTERAFERLQRTDAAIFMEFHERIMASIPNGSGMIETAPIIVKPNK